MTDTTETYWDADGQSLQTFAFNIVTLGGDRMAPIPVRGDDITVPYMPGTVWTPKVPNQRVISLGMWVIGANEDGTIPDDEDGRRTFDKNWRMLRRLLWRYRTQFTLTKRFWVPTEDLEAAGVDITELPQNGSWSLISASAKASYHSGMEPMMSGPSRAAFVVNLLLSDPYFYGDTITIPFSTSTEPEDPGPVQGVFILGDDRTTEITFDYEGPLTSPTFTLTEEPSTPWIRYGSDVADGDSAQVKVKTFSAVHTDSLATYGSSGYVQHYGDRFWFFLDPGERTIALSVQEGTGTADLIYRPAYL